MKKLVTMYDFIKMKKENKTIYILCVIIIIALIGSLWIILKKEKQSDSEELYAKVYQNRQLIKEINLSEVKESYRFTINGENANENVVEVRQGEIGIVSATCPDHLCVNMGFIHDGSMPVTCLPNQVVIEICNKSDDTLLDGAAY